MNRIENNKQKNDKIYWNGTQTNEWFIIETEGEREMREAQLAKNSCIDYIHTLGWTAYIFNISLYA